MSHSVLPTQEQMQALTEDGPDGAIVMVNLLKYREKAAYDRDRPEAKLNLSGKDAYRRYSAVAVRCIGEAGGNIVWAGEQALIFIGGPEQDWDEVVCVRYPSRVAFLQMVERPDYLAASYHREAGLARTALLCCSAGTVA